jgi:hypothetical protein
VTLGYSESGHQHPEARYLGTPRRVGWASQGLL